MQKMSDPRLSPNEEARHLVIQSIQAAYSDVLQREPSAEEIDQAMSVSLLTLDGMVQFIRNLLCTPEFLSRFALVLSPMLLARVLINQIQGRTPTTQDEINQIARRIFESGWLASVNQLLADPAVHQRVLAEIRGRAQEMKRLAAEAAEHHGAERRAAEQRATEAEQPPKLPTHARAAAVRTSDVNGALAAVAANFDEKAPLARDKRSQPTPSASRPSGKPVARAGRTAETPNTKLSRVRAAPTPVPKAKSPVSPSRGR